MSWWRRGRAVLLGALLLGGVAAPAPALAEDCRRVDRLGWAVPDHAKLQTGGYLGLITLGVGYSAVQVIDVDLYYGWVPESVGGKTVHSVAARLAAHPPPVCLSSKLRWTYLSAGLGAVMTFGRGFFVVSPDPYPATYYPVTALRSFFVLGTELSLLGPRGDVFASHGLTLELTALDRYVIAWLGNPELIDAWEPWSLSLGYKAAF